jgi:hypothetical protein
VVHRPGAPALDEAPVDEAPLDEAPLDEAPVDDASARQEQLLAGFGTLRRLLDDGADALAAAMAADAAMSRDAAARARALAAFARRRPSSLMDRRPGEQGAASATSRSACPAALTQVSEWAADEVAGLLGLSTTGALALLVESVVLVEQLPTTLAKVEDGSLGWAHAKVLIELLGPVGDAKRAAIEERVLSRAAGKTPPQLRAAAHRVIARIDADGAADRAAKAARAREVRLHAGQDAMSALVARLPTPVGRAVYAALEQYADAAKADRDERSKAERMADCLADLVLRPGENGLPPVQVQLTVVALVETLLGGDEPGEVDGQPIPAAVVRELAYALGLLPRPVSGSDPTAAEAAPVHDIATADDATEDIATADIATADIATADDAAAGDRVRALAQLLGIRGIAGTALAERPHLALADALTGSLVALTDATGLRAAVRNGRGLGPPPESHGYRPSAELDRFVRARDRRCRFPGCRARPRRCDLDHTCPYPHGPTAAGNLCCLCEHHHRLSHQAPGWSIRATSDGGLAWHPPGCQVLTTHPPRYGADDDLPPDTAPTAAAPTSSVSSTAPIELPDRVLVRPRPPVTVDDDPPPF